MSDMHDEEMRTINDRRLYNDMDTRLEKSPDIAHPVTDASQGPQQSLYHPF